MNREKQQISIASKATSLSPFYVVLHSTLITPATAKTNSKTCYTISLLITRVCVCHVDENIVIVEIGSCDIISI